MKTSNLSIHQQMNGQTKIQYIHTVECYSALKRKEILFICYKMNLVGHYNMLSEINLSQRHKYYMIPLI